jgi:alkyl hydroperoxide reductase subunit AhpC
MPGYQSDLDRFSEYNTQVLGVSVDSVASHIAWADSLGGIDYPLLSDFWPHGDVAKQYGALTDAGHTERIIYIVDKEGVIRYVDNHDIDDTPENNELFKVLEELK